MKPLWPLPSYLWEQCNVILLSLYQSTGQEIGFNDVHPSISLIIFLSPLFYLLFKNTMCLASAAIASTVGKLGSKWSTCAFSTVVARAHIPPPTSRLWKWIGVGGITGAKSPRPWRLGSACDIMMSRDVMRHHDVMMNAKSTSEFPYTSARNCISLTPVIETWLGWQSLKKFFTSIAFGILGIDGT